MKNKSDISKNYFEELKNKYSGLQIRSERKAFFTGSNKGNIGGAIANKFEQEGIICEITCLPQFDSGSDQKDLSDFDILVLNQGETQLDWIENQEKMIILRIVNNNLTSQIIQVKDFVQQTINRKYIKTIILIGSMAYDNVLNGSSPYCAAKAGLNHFAKCIAWELAPKGYRVFIVNPSNVQDAPMSEKTIQDLMRYRNLDREQAEKYWSDCCPMYEFLTKKEIAEICYNLTRDEFKYLSGSNIDLKGGQR